MAEIKKVSRAELRQIDRAEIKKVSGHNKDR
jgi:hypothetical protein